MMPALAPQVSAPEPSSDPNELPISFLRRISKSLKQTRPDLRDYVKAAWPILEPSRPLIMTWAAEYILEHLTAVDTGQINRLLINIPPRTLKSILVSVMWPTWSWTAKPWMRWIFSSYSGSLATKHSIDRRRLIESPWYKKEWGDMSSLEADQNQKTEFQNTQRGVMVATSVGGSITGKGGDRLVLDDLINPEDAESKAGREAAIDFYRRTLLTRLDDKKAGAIVVIEQRLHKADLSETVLKEGGWTYLKVPAVSPARVTVKFPLSGREYIREEGAVICEEREDKATLVQLKVAMGSRAFSAQYQQEPIAADSGYFHTGWWKFYNPDALPSVSATARGWDTAVKMGQGNDFTVGTLIHRCENGYYVDPHRFKGRIPYHELKQRIKQEAAARPANYETIEDASAGASVIQDLRNETALPIIPFLSVKDKVTRASMVSPLVEAGKVFLPEGAPWVMDFMDTLASFPDVEHDDEVDSFVIALMQLSGKALGGGAGITVLSEDEANLDDDAPYQDR